VEGGRRREGRGRRGKEEEGEGGRYLLSYQYNKRAVSDIHRR
jgi:hypothetical protein